MSCPMANVSPAANSSTANKCPFATIKKPEEEENIPSEIRLWLSLYRMVPNVLTVPYTDGKVGLTFSLVAAVFFFACQRTISFVLWSMGWTFGHTYKLAVSCFPPLIHSILLIPGLARLLSTHTLDPSAKMSTAPQWWQDGVHALLQVTTGYMTYDIFNSCFFLWWVPGTGFVPTASNMSFQAHHVVTSIYMTSCRVVGAGHYSAMLLMFAGEFTNPLQNMRTILEEELKEGCCLDGIARMMFPYVDLGFGVGYAFFRIVVGPVVAVWITYDLLLTKRGRSHVRWGISLLWVFLMWAVLIGSLPWIYESLDIIKKYVNEGMHPEL